MMGIRTDRIAKTDSPQIAASSQKQTSTTEINGGSIDGPAVEKHQQLKTYADKSQRITQLKAYQTMADNAVFQRQANATGLPDNLKSGIENLSGYSMDDVKVHYNSAQPAQLKGKVAINDDAGLEKEADEMGAMALQMKTKEYDSPTGLIQRVLSENTPVQRYALVAGPSFQGRVGNLNFDTAIALDVINLRAWVEEAAVHNFPALWRVAELVLLNADSIEQDDPTLIDFILQRAERAKAEIEVEGAEMIYSDNNFANLRPVDTVVMRAINTGDMYHIRAVLGTNPRFRLLIWGVNPVSRSQARMVASLINDRDKVFATDKQNPPAGFNQTETRS